MPRPLAALHWDNSFARLPEIFYQRVQPTPLPQPRLVAFNPDAAALIDLETTETAQQELVAIANGDRTLPRTAPVAAIYAGHQFGSWVPELGDGRAILLGEVVGARHRRWDIQVKGGGPTNFSRRGDGRAVLRSTIREYLGGEAMSGLGIATTRALAIVGSDAPVYRERVETAALLVRLSPTHVRFGSFELFASRGMTEALTQLADHVIDGHFTQLLTLPAQQRYAAWYGEVVARTARLMAAWTATGFAHGVMNTDNMSIVGVTLDFGPYGWMDHYDRGFIPNHSDPAGRYAFDQQPRVGLWNCARLGEALYPLVQQDDALAALEGYRGAFETEIDRLMRAKLGLVTAEPDDVGLVADALALLHGSQTDYTRFFRTLSRYTVGSNAIHAETGAPAPLDAWLARYAQRLSREDSHDPSRHQRMLRVNPKFVLRNWMAQEAISEAEAGRYQPIEALRLLLRTPFDEHEGSDRYAEKPPAWARQIAVSCSS